MFHSVGVGFSYADFGETVETTEDAAKNVHAFITIFFETFEQFSGRPLHLSGESYGNDDNFSLYPGRYEVECGTASLNVPFQSISTCVRMKTALPRCQKAMQQACIDQFDMINCRAAVNFCDDELSAPMWATGERIMDFLGTSMINDTAQGRNVYDISKPCEGDLCYAENEFIKRYLDLPETRALLGIESPSNFSACSSVVNQGFNAHMDKWASPVQYYVSNLLDRGVRVLIYAGTYDWQCNWVANKLWVDKLEWSGSEDDKAQKWRNWEVGGKIVGEVKSTQLLTFATIRGAGHMISTVFLAVNFQANHMRPTRPV
ncbi:hypothetical protein C0989_004308 [Termitomyces sp. Mn162]|nr:hypothetical protein C0989_004308 [Termitomyces sp. Mn162]